METTNYKRITANVISSVSNKAVFLINPTAEDGTIYHNATIPKRWTDKVTQEIVTIEWDYASESLYELPMSQTSAGMRIVRRDSKDTHRSVVKSRLVDGKVVEYLQLTERFTFYIPSWLMRNFKVKYRPIKGQLPLYDDNFSNDDEFFGVAEDTAKRSFEQESLQDRVNDIFTSDNVFEPHIKQWEQDNPEYM